MESKPMSKRVPVYQLAEVPKEANGGGAITRYSARSQHAQLVFVDIKPQPGQPAVHSLPQDYPHEIILIVMKGAMRVEIDGHTYEMGEKSAIVVPAHAAHRGTPIGEAPVSLIEVYGPPRADCLHLVEYQHPEFRDKGMAWNDPRDGAARKPGSARLPVYDFADIPRESRLFQGRMSRFGIRTQHAQVVFADIKPQPEEQQTFHRLPHDHPYDMMLVILKGTMRVQMEGHDYNLTEGSVLLEPPYFMHRGYATGDGIASCLEVYAPPRTDYLNLVEYQQEQFDGGDDAWIKKELDSWNPPRL